MGSLNIPEQCNQPFERVSVSHAVRGLTLVSWRLSPNFMDPLPHTFQLLVGRTGNPLATDWTEVGPAQLDVSYLSDTEARLYGDTNWTHYAVRLITATDTYDSNPEPATGRWSFQDWTLVQEIIRKENLYLRDRGIKGYLLKRRLYGQKCSCVDFQTGECRNPDCEDCFGTGIDAGFFQPMVVYAGTGESGVTFQQTDVGTDAQRAARRRMLNEPQILPYDVWVRDDTRERFVVRRIDPLVEHRGRIVVISAAMKLVPPTNAVYNVPIPNVTPDIFEDM